MTERRSMFGSFGRKRPTNGFVRDPAPGQGYMGPPGRPLTGYADAAPLAPSWAQVQPYRDFTPPPEQNFAMGPGAYIERGTPDVRVPSLPRAARARVSGSDSPGAYDSFADYANSALGLSTEEPAQDNAAWRQRRDFDRPVGVRSRLEVNAITGAEVPIETPRGPTDGFLAEGEEAPQHGLNPETAWLLPRSPSYPTWTEANQRARAQIASEGADPTQLRREADRELGRIRGRAYVGNYSRW